MVEAVLPSQLERLLSKLQSVKPAGPDQWLARCPAHEDHDLSLSVAVAGDGRILLHDFGGCPVEAVVDALGLTMAALMPNGSGSGDTWTPRGEAIAAYDYQDEAGRLLLLERTSPETVDWGYASDLGYVNERLDEILSFLGWTR